MSSPSSALASAGVNRLRGPFGARWEDICAGAVLVILPALLIFLFLRRYIYNGFAQGATK